MRDLHMPATWTTLLYVCIPLVATGPAVDMNGASRTHRVLMNIARVTQVATQGASQGELGPRREGSLVLDPSRLEGKDLGEIGNIRISPAFFRSFYLLRSPGEWLGIVLAFASASLSIAGVLYRHNRSQAPHRALGSAISTLFVCAVGAWLLSTGGSLLLWALQMRDFDFDTITVHASRLPVWWTLATCLSLTDLVILYVIPLGVAAFFFGYGRSPRSLYVRALLSLSAVTVGGVLLIRLALFQFFGDSMHGVLW